MRKFTVANRKCFILVCALFVSTGCISPQQARDEDIIAAATSGDRHRVERLLKLGANIEARDEGEHTPLYAAATNGHFEVVRFLISKGANVNATDTHGTTVLDMAGRVEIRKELIRAGAKSSHDLKKS